jgi:hypothetical protein
MRQTLPLLIASTLLAYLGCSKAIRIAQGDENGQCYPNQSCNGDLSCSSGICMHADPSATGGAGGTGGATSTGGQPSQGGGSSGGSGGNDSGGTTGSGGATGGSSGDTSSGGAAGSGGADSGGSSGSGGGAGSGGSSGGSGGGAAGSTGTCGPGPGSNAVSFCNGLALGAMTGYGWVALGSGDTISNPTCDTAQAPITSLASCAANTNWSRTDALCMSGLIPALPPTPLDADYKSNWGVQVGVNSKDPIAAMGGSGWKTITFTMSGSPTSGLRAILHKSGDAEGAGYCAPMTPGTAIPITTFNSKCWDSTGDLLTDTDGANIDQVGVQVSSTAAEIKVESLCMTKLEFGN